MLDLRAAKVMLLAALAMLLLLTTNFSTAVFTSSSTSTATVSAAADWTPPTVSLGLVAALVRGEVPMAATASDADSGLASLRIERRTGSGAWTELCASSTAAASCTWTTSGGADGPHEVRATAVDRAQNSAVSAVTTVTVDNTAPTVELAVPAGTLSGSRTFSATATDATSGVAEVSIQYALAGSGRWSELCTPVPAAASALWTCDVQTAMLGNGRYDFRATATDRAGNGTTSAVVPGRLVDNAGPSVALENPGAVLSGRVRLAASASSPAGVASVTFEYAPTGTETWSPLATSTASPYAYEWNTNGVPDGSYDVRAVALDALRRSATSVSKGHVVRNVRGDVQVTNGAGTRGLVDQGDTITLTYPGPVALDTLVPGWTGEGRDVTVRLSDTGTSDTLTVWAGGQQLRLGAVDLRQNVVKKNLDVDAAMTARTVTVAGVARTTVTITVGYLHPSTNGSLESPVQVPATMVWTPAGASEAIVELPPEDVDF